MNIEKSLKRIKWRIESNSWKSNQTDIDALNEIIDFVNQKQKEQFDRHELFAKLYIHNYSEFNEKYKSNVFDEIPIKELNKLLQQPISYHIQRFTDKLNDQARESLFEDLKLNEALHNHPATISQEEKNKETDILFESLNNNEENQKKLYGESWDYQTVQEILHNQLNQFLNTYYDRKNFNQP